MIYAFYPTTFFQLGVYHTSEIPAPKNNFTFLQMAKNSHDTIADSHIGIVNSKFYPEFE